MIGIYLIAASVLCCFVLLVAYLYMRPGDVELHDRSVDLGSVLPIQAIAEGMIINGNGELTVGYHLLLPEIFSLTESKAETIHKQLQALCKELPSGTVIHQQSFIYTGRYLDESYSNNALAVENQKYFNTKEILNNYVNIYFTFPEKAGHVRKSSTSNSLIRKMNYPFKRPYKNLKKRLETLEPVIMNIENALSSVSGFAIKRMDDTELNNAVYDYLNQSYEKPVRDASTERVNPMSVSNHDEVKIGDQHIAVLSLTQEGESVREMCRPAVQQIQSEVEMPERITSPCSMCYPVGLGLPFDHIVNCIIEVLDVDQTKAAISSERRSLNFISPFYAEAAEAQLEQKRFEEEVTKNEWQTTSTAFNIILKDSDPKSLMRNISVAQQAFSSMAQSSCYVENAETLNLFFSSMPGNAHTNYRGFINISQLALCYLQKESVYISSPDGHLYSDRFGNPVKINLWDNPNLNNRNKVVIGPSGSGKSFWLNNYIYQSYVRKNDIIIIDIGGSFRSMVDLNQGKYFDSKNKKQFAFNPFLCEKDKNGRYIYIDTTDKESTDDQIKRVKSVLAYIWKQTGTMTPAEGAILSKSIKGFYEHVNNSSVNNSHKRITPNLIEYAKYLKEVFIKHMTEYEKKTFSIEELLLLMEPYTTGELSYLLNSEENIDIINDRLIAFDMEEAEKQEYFPLIVLIALQMIADKIKKREGVGKELIIDEALNFLSDPKFGDFIAYLYRTCRKKEGAVMIAAQNVNFIKNSPPDIKDSILINCDSKIILDHSQYRENLPDIKKTLSITDSEIGLIESIQTKQLPGGEKKWTEFFIKLGNESHVFRNEVSPFTGTAFDSREKTRVRLKQFFNETGSTYTAINLLLDERKKHYS